MYTWKVEAAECGEAGEEAQSGYSSTGTAVSTGRAPGRAPPGRLAPPSSTFSPQPTGDTGEHLKPRHRAPLLWPPHSGKLAPLAPRAPFPGTDLPGGSASSPPPELHRAHLLAPVLGKHRFLTVGTPLTHCQVGPLRLRKFKVTVKARRVLLRPQTL